VVRKQLISDKFTYITDFKQSKCKAYIITFEMFNSDYTHLDSTFLKKLIGLFKSYFVLIETCGTKIKVGGYLEKQLSINLIVSDEFLKCYNVISLDIIGYNFLSDVYENMKLCYTKANLKQEDIKELEKEQAKLMELRQRVVEDINNNYKNKINYL
jgi:hypothetical protein